MFQNHLLTRHIPMRWNRNFAKILCEEVSTDYNYDKQRSVFNCRSKCRYSNIWCTWCLQKAQIKQSIQQVQTICYCMTYTVNSVHQLIYMRVDNRHAETHTSKCLHEQRLRRIFKIFLVLYGLQMHRNL